VEYRKEAVSLGKPTLVLREKTDVLKDLKVGFLRAGGN
jgi:UDP-N-acetylglucosamine 2-epimerase